MESELNYIFGHGAPIFCKTAEEYQGLLEICIEQNIAWIDGTPCGKEDIPWKKGFYYGYAKGKFGALSEYYIDSCYLSTVTFSEVSKRYRGSDDFKKAKIAEFLQVEISEMTEANRTNFLCTHFCYDENRHPDDERIPEVKFEQHEVELVAIVYEDEFTLNPLGESIGYGGKCPECGKAFYKLKETRR